MKKHIQRQLLGLMKSVVNGVTYIKENPQTNQTQTVYNDCKAAISMIRKTFESELSEKSYTSYTELFDKVMNGLEESAGIQDEAARKQLLDEAINALHDLDRTLQSETEINKEIVFFPYKASMWDSMESIWRAAKEDSRCDVYVVPIPHFANGIMTYEGNLYPKDVQVIHYSAYKMEVQKPDVTYIHQPYDGHNRTHKDDITYFASELKKHTKKLVYVPYYVTCGTAPDYAISLPSFKAVDLIVVESEQIRERYLEFWPEEKVMALGSPKFDKVVYHQQNGVAVPPSWKEKIEGKKVVLYNTSIGPLLSDVPTYLKKLKYVFESFESSEDMVLLWRPHPLIKSKLQPVPAYLQAYTRLEQYFVQNNIGILDLEPDLHVAIAVSDIYYGDSTSMFPLFAATGKPMVLQDLSKLDDLSKEDSKLRFEAIAVKDEKTMFGFSTDINALFQIDLITGSLKFLGSIPPVNFSVQYLCISMDVVGDKVILVPFADKGKVPYFVEYSISNNTFVIKELREKSSFKTPWENNGEQYKLFNSTFKLENSIFFVPFNYGAIVEYNTKTEACAYHEAPLAALDISSLQSGYFRQFGCQSGSDLYLPLADSNQVLKFSMENGDFSLLRIGKKTSRFSSCYSDGESLWLVSFIDGAVTQYDINKSQVKSQSKAPQGIKKHNDNGVLLGSIIGCNTSLLLVPRYSNEMAVYNTESKKMEKSDVFPVPKPVMQGQYSKAVFFKDNAYLFDNYSRKIVKLDSTTNMKEEIKLTLSNTEIKKLEDELFNQLSMCSNKALATSLQEFNFNELLNNAPIAEYLKMLADGPAKVAGQVEFMQDINLNMDGTSGEKIHNYVMGRI